MSAERPTFSPFWHRVRGLRPRLRPQVQVTRQFYRGRRWHVVQDPSSNQFYRLSPAGYALVGLLDGRRSVEEAWTLALRSGGDAAPTQHEVIQLIAQLHTSNLLSLDASPEVEQLLSRGRERLARRVATQAVGLLSLRLRLFNPDALVSRVEPVLRPLLGRAGLALWAAWVLFAIVSLLPHAGELQSGLGSALAPANWGWLLAVYLGAKAWHELGHAVLCKRFGGQVPELGVMLLVLIPSPYVDASACWAFASKWRRMAVGAGGMIFELALAAGAAHVWLHTDGLPAQIAFNVMLTAGVSTVLFNANPLMRFDGYYILSDLLEVPNLMQRSQNMLLHLAKTFLYRVKGSVAPTADPGERAILVVFGVLALVYRVVLFFTITLYLMGILFGVGLFLAVWTAAAWFLLPSARFVHWLAAGPALHDRRGRALLTSLGLGVGVALLVGAVPAPDHRRAWGVVESVQRSGVYVRTDGFVAAAHARPGDAVRAGDPIVTLRSPELEAQLALSRAQLEEFRSLERQATASNPAAAGVARDRIEAQLQSLAFLEQRLEALSVRAPHDGVIVGDDPAALVGALAGAGTPVCEVVDTERVRVAASLTQPEAAWMFELPRERYSVRMRPRSDVSRVVAGGAVRAVPAGQRRLRHAALGYEGGGQVRTSDQDPALAMTPQFIVYVDPEPGSGWRGVPGERVALRFALPSRPLAAQWIDRLHKLVQGRVRL